MLNSIDYLILFRQQQPNNTSHFIVIVTLLSVQIFSYFPRLFKFVFFSEFRFTVVLTKFEILLSRHKQLNVQRLEVECRYSCHPLRMWLVKKGTLVFWAKYKLFLVWNTYCFVKMRNTISPDGMWWVNGLSIVYGLTTRPGPELNIAHNHYSVTLNSKLSLLCSWSLFKIKCSEKIKININSWRGLGILLSNND